MPEQPDGIDRPVFLLADDAELLGALDALAQWAEAGVVRPFAWCVAGEEEQAQLAGPDGVAAMPWGEVLLDVTRLTVVVLRRPAGPVVDEAALALTRTALRRAAPLGLTDGDDRLVQLVCPDRLPPADYVGADEAAPVVRQALGNSIDHIWALAPEDRPDPANANLGVSGARYAAHVAHGVASSLGLWESATGAFGRPELLRVPDGVAGMTKVVRSFCRIIDAGRLPDLLAVGAVRFPGRWPVPDPQALVAIQDADADRAITSLAGAFVDAHNDVLRGAPFPAERPSVREKVTLWVAIKRIFQALYNLLLSWPARKLDQVVGRAYDRAAGVVQRAADHLTGQQIVQWNEPEPERERTEEAQRVDSVRAVDGPIVATWRQFAQTSFALVDGLPFPKGVSAPQFDLNGRRAVVVDLPHLVAPRPVRGASAGGDARVCDPLANDPDLAEAERPATVEPGRLARAKRSFTWHVGVEVGTALRHAEEQVEGLRAEVAARREELQEVEEQFEPKMKRLAQLGRWLTLLVVLLAIGAGWLVWGEPDGRISRLVLVAVVAFVALIPIALLIDKRRRALIERVAELRALVKVLDLQLKYYEALLAALRRRYREYLDWCDIIAELVHEPWDIEEVEPPPPSTLASLPRPAATSIALGVFTENTIMGRVNAVRNEVFDVGWLNGWYETVKDRAMEQLRVERGLPEGASLAILDPPADTTMDEVGARRYLRRYLRSGVGRQVESSPVADQVRNGVANVPLVSLLSGVIEVTGDGSGGNADSAQTDPMRVVVRIRQVGDEGTFLGSGVVISDSGGLLTNRHVVEGARIVEVCFGDDDHWVPADVLAVSDLVDLAYLRPTVGVGRRPAARLASDAKAGPGCAVRCAGYPLQMDGSAVIVEGVVAGERQLVRMESGLEALATFQMASSPGSSGSGILDLNGDLVSVLVGGSRREEMEGVPEYLTVGVPLDGLREFVEDLEAEGLVDIPLAPERWINIDDGSSAVEPVAAFVGSIRGEAASELLEDNFVGNRSPGPMQWNLLPVDATASATADEVDLGEPIRFIHVRVEATSSMSLKSVRFGLASDDEDATQPTGTSPGPSTEEGGEELDDGAIA